MYDFEWCLNVLESYKRDHARVYGYVVHVLRKKDTDIAKLLQTTHYGWEAFKTLVSYVNNLPCLEDYLFLMEADLIYELMDRYDSYISDKLSRDSPERVTLDRFFKGATIEGARS